MKASNAQRPARAAPVGDGQIGLNNIPLRDGRRSGLDHDVMVETGRVQRDRRERRSRGTDGNKRQAESNKDFFHGAIVGNRDYMFFAADGGSRLSQKNLFRNLRYYSVKGGAWG